jgi:hypothetical protein
MQGAVFHHHMPFGDGQDAGTSGRAGQGQVETGPWRLIGVPVDWT